MDDLQDVANTLRRARQGLDIVHRTIISDGGILEGLAAVNEGIHHVKNQPCPGPDDLEAWHHWTQAVIATKIATQLAMEAIVEKAKSCEAALNAIANQLSDADREGKIRKVEEAQANTTNVVLMVNEIASGRRALPIEAQVADRHALVAIGCIDEVLGLIGL